MLYYRPDLKLKSKNPTIMLKQYGGKILCLVGYFPKEHPERVLNSNNEH